MFPVLDKDLNLNDIEQNCRSLWDRKKIHSYDNQSSKPTFSVDTPPPYVSAAHLHVGHAMSYTQAEIVVRYKRMCGYNIFYPMGFDDNGLPTERYVEQTYKIDKRKITRTDFRKLCIEETAKGAKAYEELWRALGLSVDWDLQYSTIDDRSRHTAQKSFIDLHKKGLIYRGTEPVLWDTHFETALAQADLETLERKGKMYDVQFEASGTGEHLVISTTRPELIPACVALFSHPDDDRYKSLHGQKANVPLFGHEVPILASEDVDKDFGTGLMMVCTFGDGEDVKKWKLHNLETRIVLTPGGKMNEAAGSYAGMTIEQARKKIAGDLKEQGLLVSEKTVDQKVSVGERSGIPVEFIMMPQWFINVLDHKEKFLRRAAEINWFPDWMKVRLDQWIDGLKYDWNISRQRFYGVPFPLWYVQETGEVILANEEDLPLDPNESKPPAWALEKYAGMTILPEMDVMDTWMTSSLTPLINSNWVNAKNIKGSMDIYPMSMRVQAFEIIRTWLFYTMVKSDYHTGTLPWETVMISGWGLNEQGKKISKRDLESYTDADGYNRFDPYSLIKRYGADALRYWAAGGQLGHDLRFHEREVKDGRKIVVKLWNVARMAFMYLQDFDPTKHLVAFAERPLEDRWILSGLNTLVKQLTVNFEKNDYATSKEMLNKFFWSNYCDDYLELVKSRFWEENIGWTEQDRRAAQSTLYESLRIFLGLFAPYIPYVTEEIYQQAQCFGETYDSLHVSAWPKYNEAISFNENVDIDVLRDVLYGVRKMRSAQKAGMSVFLDMLIIDLSETSQETKDSIAKLGCAIKGAAKALNVTFGSASGEPTTRNIKIDILPQEKSEAA